MQSPDLNRAIERVLEGELDAYADIVRQYQHEVWRIAAFALRDTAATEDLVQQVFVSVYQSLHRYEPGRDLGAWIRTSARNQVRKELRAKQRDRHKRLRYGQWLEAHFEGATEPGGEPDAQQQALRRCRKRLSPAALQALELRYDQAQGFEAIAETLGRTVAATRQLLSRTRLALRKCIERRMAHS